MSAEYNSKHGLVSRPPYELFMAFTDMRNFRQMLPEDKRDSVNATYDTIEASVNGIKIGVRVVDRLPYSKIELEDDNAPFHFGITIRFDQAPEGKTDFSISFHSEMNLMMRTMLGGKIKDALDKVVDGLVAVSEGRVPNGMNPSDFPGNFNF